MKQPNNKSLKRNIELYRKALHVGGVREGYMALMGYLQGLRLHLKNSHPACDVSAVQSGLMDFSYFTFTPKLLKNQKLKVVILFIHDTFHFEVWLAGYNKAVQTKYLKLFKENNWNKHHLASNPKEEDYITDAVLIENADFSDLDTLTSQIEKSTLQFIKDVEGFLAKHKK
jgi:hypothetical protein